MHGRCPRATRGSRSVWGAAPSMSSARAAATCGLSAGTRLRNVMSRDFVDAERHSTHTHRDGSRRLGQGARCGITVRGCVARRRRAWGRGVASRCVGTWCRRAWARGAVSRCVGAWRGVAVRAVRQRPQRRYVARDVAVGATAGLQVPPAQRCCASPQACDCGRAGTVLRCAFLLRNRDRSTCNRGIEIL